MPSPITHLLLLLALAAPAHAEERVTFLFAGGARGDESSPTLDQLQIRLKSLEPATSVVVFTGNYSTAELPAEGQPGRADAERAVLAHVTATRDFVKRGGRVYFLPGHRDFAAGGTAAIRRLRKFLNSAYGVEELDVMPNAGCADPIVIELTDNLGLLLVNSQWWMADPSTDPLLNQGCKQKTPEMFQVYVRDAFNEHRTSQLVIAMHHPLKSYGELGGGFSMRAHLKPLPILGTVGVLAAEAGLVPQYHTHPLVRSYVELMADESKRYGSFIFASGHDASLQLLKAGQQTQIIAGTSGREADFVTGTNEGDFAAAVPGWAEVIIEANGSGEAKLISNREVLFAAQIPPLTPFAVAPSAVAPPIPAGPIATTYSKGGGERGGALSKFFLGSFYGDAYALELPYDVLDLQAAQLEPVKTGGSFQTNSLKLRDAQGADWSARAVTKDSGRFLGTGPTGEGAAKGTVSRGFTAMHPEAALAVPRLAKALGVLHAEPRLLYLPDQAALGKFRGYINDELVLLERSPNEPKTGVLPPELAGEPSPHGQTRFRDMTHLLERMADKPEKHRLSQEAWLRARLLDVLIGDWDRHHNQWRFAAIPRETHIDYLPIPRDRDQAFTNYNGFALWLARITAQQPRQLQPFNDHYGQLGWLINSGRNHDPILLNQLTREQWMAVATAARAALTDEVIDEAFAQWHREAFELDGARIAAHLKVRRDNLLDVAEEYFERISRNADVLGSTNDDTFELTWEDSGGLRLQVRNKGGAFFDRVFVARDTAELRVYGLEGDDTLVVRGAPHRAIGVRFVGGDGSDVVTAGPGQHLSAGALAFYDAEDGGRIDPSIEVRDERSPLAHLNQYERTENHEQNAGAALPGLAANPDDGVLFGARYRYVLHGYKKSPFAARHEVTGRFATATLGMALDYEAIFPQSLQLLDQHLEVAIKGPTWTRNFFGLTNRYAGEDEPLDFYRVRQAAVEGRYGVSYGFGGERSRVGAQLTGQAFFTGSTSVTPDLTREATGARAFAGVRLFAESHTFDRLALPTRGVGVHASIESRFDPVKGGQLSTNYALRGAVAIPFDRARRFVLVSRAGIEAIVGEHPFYFAPSLGDTELRAYHPHQLAGEVAFSHTTDLRIDVFRSASELPGTIGINLSADHGRVFGPSISGDNYHLSLGGGVWWSVMDTLGVSLGYYRGLDGGARVSLVVGPLFAPSGP